MKVLGSGRSQLSRRRQEEISGAQVAQRSHYSFSGRDQGPFSPGLGAHSRKSRVLGRLQQRQAPNATQWRETGVSVSLSGRQLQRSAAQWRRYRQLAAGAVRGDGRGGRPGSRKVWRHSAAERCRLRGREVVAGTEMKAASGGRGSMR